MPSIKKIKFFRQVAVVLSILWTIMTCSFYVYQIKNEHAHILDNTISTARTYTKQTEDLISWAFEQKAKARPVNHILDIKTDFSLRDLIYDMATRKNAVIQIETNYLDDDMHELDKKIKETIIKGQSTKKDAYIPYEIDGEDYVYYFRPLLAKESCIKCHIHDEDKVGDLIGNINFSVKVDSLKKYNSKNYYFFIFTYLSTWILGLIVIWWIRYKSKEFFDEKSKNYEESIYSLVDMMERRDSYTAGHSKRVAEYALLIAQKLELSSTDEHLIYRAGMLHDIGKIEVPDALLLKPDDLTDGEHDLIKSHAKVGYELLSRDPFYDLALIVLHHHENFDGSGYPYALKGDEIPYLSQIICVADVFDAVTTNRAYRQAMSKAEAINILKEGSGTKFNPKIVKEAIKIFSKLDLATDEEYNPKDMIEEIRFSYYFRDQLTGHFNINYLKFLLKHKTYYEHICAYYLNFKNFSAFNKLNSWKNGDLFLQKVADDLQKKYPSSVIVRLFADNFLILSLDRHIDIDKSEIDLKYENLEVKFKHIDFLKDNIDTFDNLEDLM